MRNSKQNIFSHLFQSSLYQDTEFMLCLLMVVFTCSLFGLRKPHEIKFSSVHLHMQVAYIIISVCV